MNNTYLGPPPDGDQDKRPIVIGMTALWTGLSVLFVVLRMLSRVCILKSVGWDDWSIVAAALGTIIGAGLDFPEIGYGFGKHRYYITNHAYREYLKYGYGEWIQTFATLTFTKISICFFLLRIAISKALVRPIQAGIVFLIISNVVLTFLWIFQCRPIDATWILEKQATASCFSKQQMEQIIFIQAVISAVSDFVLAGFPILMLRDLHVSLRKKIGLCSLMGLGVITGVCCVVRTALNGQTEAEDLTWGGIDNWAWRCIEVNVGIIAACIPALLPGWRFVRGQVNRLTTKGGTKATSDYERRDRATYWRRHPRTPRKASGEQSLSLTEKMTGSRFCENTNNSTHQPQLSGSTQVTIKSNPGNFDGASLGPTIPPKVFSMKPSLIPRGEEHVFPRNNSTSSTSRMTQGGNNNPQLGLTDHEIIKTTTFDVDRNSRSRQSAPPADDNSLDNIGNLDLEKYLAPSHSPPAKAAPTAGSGDVNWHNSSMDHFDSSDSDDFTWLRMTGSNDPLADRQRHGS